MGEVDPCKVYMGNLSESVTEDELQGEMEKFGRVEKVWVAKNPPGFGFVWYTDPRDASDAVAALEGKRFPLGTTEELKIEIARPKTSREDRSRAAKGPGGYRVKITNLTPGTDWREIKDHFRPAGEVAYANVRGEEGIAEFSSEDDRERAIAEFDGTVFKDSRIAVEKTGGSTSEFFSRRGIDPASRAPADERDPYESRKRSRPSSRYDGYEGRGRREHEYARSSLRDAYDGYDDRHPASLRADGYDRPGRSGYDRSGYDRSGYERRVAHSRSPPRGYYDDRQPRASYHEKPVYSRGYERYDDRPQVSSRYDGYDRSYHRSSRGGGYDDYDDRAGGPSSAYDDRASYQDRYDRPGRR